MPWGLFRGIITHGWEKEIVTRVKDVVNEKTTPVNRKSCDTGATLVSEDSDFAT